MNKLVSKNPIQRFKLGNRIQKAGLGDILKGAGDFVDSGAQYGSNLIKRIPGIGWAWGKYDNFVGSMINPPKNTLNQKPSKTQTSQNKVQTPQDGTYYEKTVGGKVVERGRWKNGKQIPIEKTTVNKGGSTGGSKKGQVTRRSNNYVANPIIQNRAAAGYTLPEGVTSVTDTQTMLKNAGFDLGKYGVDGVWGKETQAAYDAWKNKLAANVGGTTGTTPNITSTPTNTGTTVSGNGYSFTLPTNTNANTNTYESYYPGTYSNLNNMFTRKGIRSNRGTNYSNVNEYWDWLQNNKDSEDYKVWSNIMGNDGYLNKEIFDNVMSQYGIRDNLGRRDSGRLSNLLNDLNLIGVQGRDKNGNIVMSDARKAFLTNFNRNLPNSEEINEYVRTNTPVKTNAPARPNLSTINWGLYPNTISSGNLFTNIDKSEYPRMFPAGTKISDILNNNISFNLTPYYKQYKKGGLISRNPINRFKNGGIQKFQKAGNLPTAPKAEDRYRGGQRVNVETKGGRYGGNDRMEIKEVQGKKPGMFGSVPFIRQTVVHSSVSPDYNDTTYIEVPERKNFLVQRKLRGVEKHPSVFHTYYSKVYPFYGSILPDLGSGSKQEYETLKQRFNTAWNIAK